MARSEVDYQLIKLPSHGPGRRRLEIGAIHRLVHVVHEACDLRCVRALAAAVAVVVGAGAGATQPPPPSPLASLACPRMMYSPGALNFAVVDAFPSSIATVGRAFSNVTDPGPLN